MARYLLDTNICIYIRQKRPAEVLARFEHLAPGEAVLSVITYGELLYGANKSAHRQIALDRLADLITLLPVLPLPLNAAEHFSAIRAQLAKTGQQIGGNDLWIAAHALAADLTVVTNNENEFRRVNGLNVENWVEGGARAT